MRFDIDLRLRDDGRPDPKPLLVPHEIKSAGVVIQDKNVMVTCALVDHLPIAVALSCRFDTPAGYPPTPKSIKHPHKQSLTCGYGV